MKLYMLRNKLGIISKRAFLLGQFRCDGIWDNNETMGNLEAGGCSDDWRLLGHMGSAPGPLDYDTDMGERRGYHILRRKSKVLLQVT